MSTSSTADAAETDDPYESVYHLYKPHVAGLPNLRVYFTELWRRRQFAFEMSKATMRAANSMTFFGQAWLIINPLLLALVYYFIVNVLSNRASTAGWEYFSRLTSGLFLFYFVQGSVLTGASSVVSAGKIITNTAMPRLLLPLGAVRTGFFRFLPTLPVYFVFHILAGNPWGWHAFVVAPIFLCLLVIFTSGLAAVFSALQVYFRDTASFLPYFMRIWLYVSPVLWTIDMIKEYSLVAKLAPFNPLYSLIGGYGEALQHGVMPSPSVWLAAIGWATVSVVVGFGYFMSRERDFAVRL